MIRKLLLPAAAAVLLGGCMTAGYGYRYGGGDYYGGAPVDYGYDAPYSYGYPSGYYGYSTYGGYGYASPYGYSYGSYGYPYYGYPYYGYPYGGSYYYYRPATQPQVDPTPDRTRSPWRDLERVRRQSVTDPAAPLPRRKIALPPVRSQPRMAPTPQSRPPMPQTRTPVPQVSASGLSGRVRQAKERDAGGATEP